MRHYKDLSIDEKINAKSVYKSFYRDVVGLDLVEASSTSIQVYLLNF